MTALSAVLSAIPADEPMRGRRVDLDECLNRIERLVEAACTETPADSKGADIADVILGHVESWRLWLDEQEEAREAAQCTCRPRAVRPTDTEPPDIRRDRNCPLHGIDPDRARDERRDA